MIFSTTYVTLSYSIWDHLTSTLPALRKSLSFCFISTVRQNKAINFIYLVISMFSFLSSFSILSPSPSIHLSPSISASLLSSQHECHNQSSSLSRIRQERWETAVFPWNGSGDVPIHPRQAYVCRKCPIRGDWWTAPYSIWPGTPIGWHYVFHRLPYTENAGWTWRHFVPIPVRDYRCVGCSTYVQCYEH